MDVVLEVPEHETRLYSTLTLSNGLRVVLVSDPETKERAAAAMTVNVGHMSDPADSPGLAHFLEHLLFQGSEKYPGDSTFKTFLASHGGVTNASTSAESTTFKFAVDERFYSGALDIWAQVRPPLLRVACDCTSPAAYLPRSSAAARCRGCCSFSSPRAWRDSSPRVR